MTTTVLDQAAGAVLHTPHDSGYLPATCRIGLLGLGNVGSAFARLARDGAAVAPASVAGAGAVLA